MDERGVREERGWMRGEESERGRGRQQGGEKRSGILLSVRLAVHTWISRPLTFLT